jgi:hypothetical protein
VRLPLRRHVCAIAVAAVLIGASPGVTGTTASAVVTSKALAVPLTVQIGNNWCWAASTRAILSYMFGTTYGQCNQAADLFGVSTCCNYTTPPASCDKPATLGQVEYIIQLKKSVYSSQEGNTLSYTNFKAEIDKSDPFWVRIGWGGSLTNGHVMVVRAYYQADGQAQQIGLMDPGKSVSSHWPYYTWSYWTRNSVFTWTNTLWRAYK